MAVLRDRPYVQFNFLVDLGDGVTDGPHAGFSEVSGIGMDVAVIEYRTGNSKENNVTKLTGLNRVSNVTLKRGLIGALNRMPPANPTYRCARFFLILVSPHCLVDTMATSPSPRRRHSAALKARVLAACALPGASVSRIARDHNLHVSLVHAWRSAAGTTPHDARMGPTARSPFIQVPMNAAASSSDIRVELQGSGSSITVTWPMSAAAQCSAWLRELLQ